MNGLLLCPREQCSKIINQTGAVQGAILAEFGRATRDRSPGSARARVTDNIVGMPLGAALRRPQYRPGLRSANLNIIEMRDAQWYHRSKTDFPQMFGTTLSSMLR
jgi:hypothetical protein